MPSGKHQVTLELPIADVWNFVKDMDHWAPLVPGYISHEKLSERQSKWAFKESVGILKKKIEMLITINEWIESTKVTFSLKGINENVSGDGYFEAEAITASRTKMTGYLELTAAGALGSVMNAVLKNSLPKTGEELTNAVAEKLLELHPSHK
ncbi:MULTISPECIES: CoxG family protein [unclassified Bacillus (in: firmicutes)]|uniref:CoxG family protein n=1 Tax=unclassified Bacillus (in: firmicutes) TaxID=185979 RepID=UPI0008EFF012|nr:MULTISPECIES: SRPBCC family protein [unclassified Bacillus (in: firmicutes)]SFA85821.1 Carbon monoxide dehydrogenase subunit G [Bacillus sp. UNCCL13]SFQ83531.1 Carbon monoxide dehydrogenase subunit G [Bacillus sp. cl95]